MADSDRNLLIGILAVQLDFVGKDDLIRAMNQWVLQKDVPFEEILVEQGFLDESGKRLLVALVEKHLEQHGRRPAQSLAALSSVGGLKTELGQIDDDELRQSLATLKSDDGTAFPGPTVWVVGTPSDVEGRFRILRPHRKGGLGAVHVARDEELNREVALKEVRDRFARDPEAQNRLRVEAEITGGLEHPGIVPVYGLGSYPDGRPFYCMRFIQGDSLAEAIKKFRRARSTMSASQRNLRLRNLLSRFVDVCEAVAYAHSRQVLHRDLKPGNIMLGRYGETLVVDWGLAKALGTEETLAPGVDRPVVPRSGSTAAPTQVGSLIGTPEYMSPEQAEGRLEELGPATDVYSLGATLYCILTGRAPFRGKDKDEILAQVKRGDFARPCEVDPRIPKPLEAICLKAMAFEPSRRYETPDELASDVERWLADEPVSAYAEPWSVRAARMLRKNRAAAMTLSAIVATTVVALVVLNVVTQRKNAVIAAQKQDIEVQKKEVENARTRLAANYSRFHGATVKMIFKAEEELSQDPEMKEARRVLTDEALALYRDFIEADTDGDFVVRDADSASWFAQLHRYSAHLDRVSGKLDPAIAKFEKAVDILRRTRKAHPQHVKTWRNLSEAIRDLGNTIKSQGRLKDAQDALAEAVKQSAELCARHRDSVACRSTHATNLFDAADVSYAIGAYETAFRQARQSADALRTIVDEGNASGREEQLLVMALLRQSAALRKLGKARQAGEPVAEVMRRVAARTKDLNQLGNRHTRARAYLEQAQVYHAVRRNPGEVEASVTHAIFEWEKLASQFSERPVYRRYLADAKALRARARMRRGRIADARSDLERGLALTDELLKIVSMDPELLRVRSQILMALAQCAQAEGKAAESRRRTDEAVKQLEAASKISPEYAMFDELLREARKLAESAGN